MKQAVREDAEGIVWVIATLATLAGSVLLLSLLPKNIERWLGLTVEIIVGLLNLVVWVPLALAVGGVAIVLLVGFFFWPLIAVLGRR